MTSGQLFRHTKKKNILNGKVQAGAFGLRDEPPREPEKAASLYKSNQDDCSGASHVMTVMSSRKFTFNKNPEHFLYLDVEEVLNQLNEHDEQIYFTVDSEPHCLLFYAFDVKKDIDRYLEVRSGLAELSNLCILHKDNNGNYALACNLQNTLQTP